MDWRTRPARAGETRGVRAGTDVRCRASHAKCNRLHVGGARGLDDVPVFRGSRRRSSGSGASLPASHRSGDHDTGNRPDRGGTLMPPKAALDPRDYRPPFITERNEDVQDDCTVCSVLMAVAAWTLG